MPPPATAVRSDGRGPTLHTLPPARMALVQDRRPLKAWRYVGLYSAPLMLCAGRVRIGGLPQAFWGVWDRDAGILHERTTFAAHRVALPDGAVRVRGRDVAIDLRLVPQGEPVDVISPHGRSWIWTRKTLVRALGTVRAGGRTRTVDAPALIDDSAGYHARATAWEWSAGFGTLADGRPVAWNLVAGVHDGAGAEGSASERTVWTCGRPQAVGPVTFGPGLDTIAFAGGGALSFTAEAVRERHDHLGLIRSDYVQPFGTFTGDLPSAGPLTTGFGVMERHSARW